MNFIWKDAEQYRKIYSCPTGYGSGGVGHYDRIKEFIEKNEIISVFDFGCGINHTLLSKLKVNMPHLKLIGYDPGITDNQLDDLLINKIPDDLKVDMIVSTDCLEHVYKDELDQCWTIFKKLSPKIMYHAICTRAAKKILPDGTNAHKTVEPPEWWKNTIESQFLNYNTIWARHNTNEMLKICLKRN